MIDFIKDIKENKRMEVGQTVCGYCEWGEVHYFELKRTDSWKCEEPTYELYIEEQRHEEDRFAINFTGTIKDLITTLEAIDNIYYEGETNEN